MSFLNKLVGGNSRSCRLSLSALAALAAMGSTHAAALDVAPPVLTSFSTSGAVDAAATGQFVTVRFTATDDLSGIFTYYVTLESPSGAKITQDGLVAPTKSLTTKIEVGYPRYTNIEFGEHFDRWSQPGTWSVTSLDVRDLAGNAKVYDKAALAAFGNTDFTVTNTKYDELPPTLVSGSISTPTLSLSKPPAGLPAGAPPVGKVSIRAFDSGTGAISGIDTVTVFFCKEPYNPATHQCAESFGLTGLPATPVRGSASNILAADQVRQPDGSAIHPGVFRVWSIGLNELAGHNVGFTDIHYGGETDFAALFPTGTTITVNP
jgi:hypothetical protein